MVSESISISHASPCMENRNLQENIDPSASGTNNHPSHSYFPIASPLVLLNLNPKQPIFRLVRDDQTRKFSFDQVQRLRYEVASALIQHAKGEKYRRRIREHNRTYDSKGSRSDGTAAASPDTQFVGMISAYELFALELHRSQWKGLSTGCQDIDLLFKRFHPPSSPLMLGSWTKNDQSTMRHHVNDRNCEGRGIPFGYITQLSGPPTSGKTQLVLSVISQPVRNWYHTWYMCSGTNNAISTAQRLQDICVAQKVSNPATLLERTTITTVNNAHQVLQRLQELESNFLLPSKDTNSFFGKPVLLVLDSCSACLGADEANLVHSVQTTLRRMTQQHHMAVILINGTVSNHFSTTSTSSSSLVLPHARTRPALGRSWNDTVPDISVWLEPATMTPLPIQNPIQGTYEDLKHPTLNLSPIIHATMTRYPRMNPTAAEPIITACFAIGAGGISDLPSL